MTDYVLIPGLWIDGSAWADVVSALADAGHRAVPLTLPAEPGTTLDDQLDAVLAAVDGADRPVVVGHSAASTLAWLVADRRPDVVARTALVGGFPTADGGAYAAFFDLREGMMPFPGWEPFEGADSADLDDAARRAFVERAIPVPGGVAQGVVRLADERRFDVPVTLVCPEYDPDDAKAWIAAGDVPELAAAKHLSYLDIDSGHWPMLTRPAELAALLAGLS